MRAAGAGPPLLLGAVRHLRYTARGFSGARGRAVANRRRVGDSSGSGLASFDGIGWRTLARSRSRNAHDYRVGLKVFAGVRTTPAAFSRCPLARTPALRMARETGLRDGVCRPGSPVIYWFEGITGSLSGIAQSSATAFAGACSRNTIGTWTDSLRSSRAVAWPRRATRRKLKSFQLVNGHRPNNRSCLAASAIIRRSPPPRAERAGPTGVRAGAPPRRSPRRPRCAPDRPARGRAGRLPAGRATGCRRSRFAPHRAGM